MKIQVLKRTLPLDGAQVIFTTVEHGLTYTGWFDKEKGVMKHWMKSSTGDRGNIMIVEHTLSSVYEWFYISDKFPRAMPRLDAKGEAIIKVKASTEIPIEDIEITH